MTGAPLTYTWTGDAMQVKPHLARVADKRFVVGQDYRLDEALPDRRSRRSHNHQFAEIAEYWEHLPEAVQADLPTPDHLRKHALIVAGYCTIEKTVFSTPSDALQAAAMSRPRSDRAEDYVVIEVAGRVVSRMTPKSQAELKMDRKDFQASKDAVLSVCARLVGGTLDHFRAPSLAPSDPPHHDGQIMRDHVGEAPGAG